MTEGSLNLDLQNFALTETELDFFLMNGYVGPFKLFEEERGPELAKTLAQHVAANPQLVYTQPLRSGLLRRTLKKTKTLVRRILSNRQQPFANLRKFDLSLGGGKYWYKSAQFFVPEVRMLGCDPKVLDKIKGIIGDNVLMWGSQVITKRSTSHRWHSDIEHIAWRGVSIWIGVDNVGPDNTMKVVPGSHLYGFTPQELCDKEGVDLSDDSSLLFGLRKVHPEAEVVKIDMKCGFFFIFDGPAWHASYDVTDMVRTAIICQYCAPSERVKIPRSFDPKDIEFETALPWTLQVSGNDHYGENRVKKIDQI